MSDPIHHAIDIDASPAEVWRAFTDLTTWPRWFPNAVAARAIGAQPFRKGGAIEVDLAVPVVGSMLLRLDVEEVDEPHRIRWIGKAWGVRGDHTYAFEDRGGGDRRWTRVTSHERLGGPLARLADRLAHDRIDEQAHQAMAKLKQLVESGGR